MVTHGCTLACEGCTNYSDYGMSGGNVSWEEHFEDLKVLTNRFNIECYGFIGGEPFMHNKFKDWVINFKEEFPYITLMVLTNAQMFPKNADWFLDAMEKYGMIYLKMTNHIPGAEYYEKSKQLVLDRFDWIEEENGYWFNKKHINDFRTENVDTFMKIVKGKYGEVKPYNNDPVEAFEICNQQICPLFYEGKLHKCSTVGMLDRMLTDHNQHDDPDWAPYINAGVDIRTATDERIKQFADNHGKPHMSLCKMCPTTKDNVFFDHIPLVVNKLGVE
jgi:organic radical activating enzyme